MSHNFSSTVRTRASTLHIAPLPESGKISDFGNPSFVLINWDGLRTDYWKFDQTLWASRLGNCIRIPLNNQTLEKIFEYFIFFTACIYTFPSSTSQKALQRCSTRLKSNSYSFYKTRMTSYSQELSFSPEKEILIIFGATLCDTLSYLHLSAKRP